MLRTQELRRPGKAAPEAFWASSVFGSGPHEVDCVAATPLFALYQGPRKLERAGVTTVEQLLERNPAGRLIVVTMLGQDEPLAAKP